MKAHFVEATSIEVLGASKTQYLELFYFVDIVTWFGIQCLSIFAPAAFAANFFYGDLGSIFKIIDALLLGEVWYFISYLFCSLVSLERYIFLLRCSVLMAPVQDQLSPSWSTFGDLLQFNDASPAIYFFSLAPTPSRFWIFAHSTPGSRLWGKSCTSSTTMHSPFFCWNIISSLEIAGATAVFLTGQINSIKDQLKLDRVANDVPGDHGHSWMPIYYYLLLFWIQLFSRARLYSGHEPCSASRDLSPSGVIHIYIHWLSLALFFRWFGFHPPVAASSFRWVPCIRCWLAPYLLPNNYWRKCCCGRVVPC